MQRDTRAGMSLYNRSGTRKYLTSSERRRFMRAAQRLPPRERLFCKMLAWSGGRISEVLALKPESFDLDRGTATFETLKKRRRGIMRQVPLPSVLLNELKRSLRLRVLQRDPLLSRRRLWHWSRVTGWRRVKDVMRLAGVHGAAAMPKGLRHTFGVRAFESDMPPHLVQRWLGHASMRTTAIYAEVIGTEERRIAARMWRKAC
jgi:integrase